MPEDALLMREIHVAKDRKTALQECRDALAFRFNVYVQPSQDKEMPGAMMTTLISTSVHSPTFG